MGAVALVGQRRLARRWRGLAVAGILLGLGFGLCLASLAAARTTASAYDRILVAARAPDAAVQHGLPLDESVKSLQTIEGITAQRVYAGFTGAADGVNPVLTSALLAPVRDDFPIELPVMRAGRLPNPNAPDEVFVNTTVAEGADLEVGQRLTFHVYTAGSQRSAETTVTIVGVGTLPAEPVRDETMVFGVVVFTRAFYDAHRDLVVYSVSSVDLARGFDARRDLAAAVGALGHDLQSARSQERDAINEALRPLIIILVALGLLAFGATAVATVQVLQRDRAHNRADGETLQMIGMERSQLRLVEAATSAAMMVVTVGTALLVMLLASPVAPIAPLHDLDPGQGLSVDVTVALVGMAAIVLTVVVLSMGMFSRRRRAARPALTDAPWLANAARGPAAVAGLTLALRSDGGRGRAWRSVAAATNATVLLALCATFVASAKSLTGTPSRYGFDADLIALNAYGDQSVSALERAFGDSDDVVAATGFTLVPLLLDGRAVPGLASTAVKGELTPTVLVGRPARTGDEIMVGRDTLDSLDAAVGDVVNVQTSSASSSAGTPVGDPVDLRIVGVATFPPVSQIGTDVPRLGVGALVTREAFTRMGGDRTNAPEFTIVRVVEGVDPSVVVARAPSGFQDVAHTNTTWLTGTKPAEIRQLDAAMPYLTGALVFGCIAVFAVVAHSLWTRARANRHDLAVLRAVGCTTRQLNVITACQALPVAIAATIIGIPVGIALGRRSFTLFAHSLAVVDDASTTFATVGSLIVAVLAAVAVGNLVSVVVGRRSRAEVALRAGDVRAHHWASRLDVR
jgi:FtsX-like permease family